MPRPAVPVFVLLLLGLAGCDQLGIESASAVAARREADGKAIGAGCRNAARSLEACFELNKRADKAAVFAGWREMNDYMIENKMAATPEHPTTVAADAGEAAVDEAAPSVQGEKGEKTDPGAKKSR